MRPTKFDPNVAAVIVKAVGDGLPNQVAARLAGVTERTLYHWLKRGRAGEEPFVQFVQDVKKAGAEAVAARVRQIHLAAMSGTWQAAAWWLERRHPDLYGSERRRIREMEKLLKELAQHAPRPQSEAEKREELERLLAKSGIQLVIGGEADPSKL